MKVRDIDAEKYPTDSIAILLNEASVKVMGFKEPNWHCDALAMTSLPLVGVVKDFILGTPYEPVRPMIIVHKAPSFRLLFISNYKPNEHQYQPKLKKSRRRI